MCVAVYACELWTFNYDEPIQYIIFLKCHFQLMCLLLVIGNIELKITILFERKKSALGKIYYNTRLFQIRHVVLVTRSYCLGT